MTKLNDEYLAFVGTFGSVFYRNVRYNLSFTSTQITTKRMDENAIRSVVTMTNEINDL